MTIATTALINACYATRRVKAVKSFRRTPLGDPVVMLVQDFFEALGFGGPDLKNTG